MKNEMKLTQELKAKLVKAQSAEEVTVLLRETGAGEDLSEQLWKEMKVYHEDKQLDLDELEAVSGGADRDWRSDGCAATVEPGSWCSAIDSCIWLDVTYDFQPTDHLCPNCGKYMYKQDTISRGGNKYEDQYRCKFCGNITTQTYYDRSDHAK